MTTRFRGAMVPPFVPPADVEALLDLKANVIRYQMTDPTWAAGHLTADSYKTWIRTHLDHVDTLIPVLKLHNAKVIIDLHTPPGGVDLSGTKPLARMFSDRQWAKETIKEIWVEIALRYKKEPTVLAYDIMNEPAGKAADVMSLMKQMVKAVRQVDHEKPCVVSAPFSDPGNTNALVLLPYRHVWYTIHFYDPLTMTHQGVYPQFPPGQVYPNHSVNKSRMIKSLADIRAFQKKTRVRLFVGEFSISIFADEDSRHRWLRDAISIFESYSWEWCFHAWREAPVWSAEIHPKVLDLMRLRWGKNIAG